MNQIALDFLKARENCRLEAYRDSAGIWTIGWGHTGSDVTEGLVWTQAQADQALIAKVANVETTVSMQTYPLKLSEQQAAALISFAYNEGQHAFATSQILQFVRAQKWFAAMKDLLNWTRAGSADSQGLLKRRCYEAALFLEGSP